MQFKVGLVIAGLLLSTPVSAQTYNGFVTQPTYDFSNTTMSWSYGPSRQNAAQVLAQLRALCSSKHHYDQYYCARGMKVLNKAYAEYKLRMAAKAAAVE